jgi:hypothetical protein
MALRTIGSVGLPAHRRAGGFDHASVYRRADRLYVAHTANDSVEVIDLARCTHDATLDGFPGVAGAAVHEDRAMLVATCRGEGTVGLTASSAPAAITRLTVGARPNALALAAGTDLALVACIGDPTPPSVAIIDLGRSEVLAWTSLPGNGRLWRARHHRCHVSLELVLVLTFFAGLGWSRHRALKRGQRPRTRVRRLNAAVVELRV